MTKTLFEQFESAYENNKCVERAKFDALMKDEQNAPKIVLADLLFEILQLSKKLDTLIDRVDELDKSY